MPTLSPPTYDEILIKSDAAQTATFYFAFYDKKTLEY